MSLLNLPLKFTSLRPHQVRAIAQVQAHFKAGKKYVFLDAPTGSGKTVIAEYIRQLNSHEAIYTCTTKSLQDQFLGDFDYAKVLKGRANYPTELIPDTYADECRDQVTANSCTFCPSGCSYKIAKGEASTSPIAVLNLDYLLNITRTPYSPFANRDLCIIDECDELETKLLDDVTITISPRQQQRLGISPPTVKTYDARNAFTDWKEWAKKALNTIIQHKATINRTTHLKSYIYYKRLQDKLTLLYNGIDEDENGNLQTDWIYVYNTKEDPSPITFKPIHVRDTANDVLLQHQSRFLLMSATIVSPEVEAFNLGLSEDEYGVVNVPSTFPPENRPVFPIDVGSMAFKKRRESLPKVIAAIQEIARRHPGERILVHTHTSHIAKAIAASLRGKVNRNIFTYEGGGDRDLALHRYKQTPGAILVAMSMQRGIDLPGDLCRVQVIAVLPRMPITDQQISYRMYNTPGGKAWYNLFTIRSLVQMTGRGVRSETDHAVTYILDNQFIAFHRANGRFFPDWWNEAVDWSGNTSRDIVSKIRG